MTIEATSSVARKIALRERIEEQTAQRQDRIAQAMEDMAAKEQAMKNLAEQDAVKVDLSSNSK